MFYIYFNDVIANDSTTATNNYKLKREKNEENFYSTKSVWELFLFHIIIIFSFDIAPYAHTYARLASSRFFYAIQMCVHCLVFAILTLLYVLGKY